MQKLNSDDDFVTNIMTLIMTELLSRVHFEVVEVFGTCQLYDMTTLLKKASFACTFARTLFQLCVPYNWPIIFFCPKIIISELDLIQKISNKQRVIYTQTSSVICLSSRYIFHLSEKWTVMSNRCRNHITS